MKSCDGWICINNVTWFTCSDPHFDARFKCFCTWLPAIRIFCTFFCINRSFVCFNCPITNHKSSYLQLQFLPDDEPTMTSTAAIHSFKSPFIYMHDIYETHSPIMVREYSEVQHKEDGNWPQFWSVGNDECPFKNNGAMRLWIYAVMRRVLKRIWQWKKEGEGW